MLYTNRQSSSGMKSLKQINILSVFGESVLYGGSTHEAIYFELYTCDLDLKNDEKIQRVSKIIRDATWIKEEEICYICSEQIWKLSKSEGNWIASRYQMTHEPQKLLYFRKFPLFHY